MRKKLGATLATTALAAAGFAAVPMFAASSADAAVCWGSAIQHTGSFPNNVYTGTYRNCHTNGQAVTVKLALGDGFDSKCQTIYPGQTKSFRAPTPLAASKTIWLYC